MTAPTVYQNPGCSKAVPVMMDLLGGIPLQKILLGILTADFTIERMSASTFLDNQL